MEGTLGCLKVYVEFCYWGGAIALLIGGVALLGNGRPLLGLGCIISGSVLTLLLYIIHRVLANQDNTVTNTVVIIAFILTLVLGAILATLIGQ